jgi:hypothetical protein
LECPKRWEHAQHNPEKKKQKLQHIDGFYAWNAQCAGNMRSIIPNKKSKNCNALTGAMLGMSKGLGTCAA